MEISRLKSLLESLIFVAEMPLKSSEMLKAIHHLEQQEASPEGEAEVQAAEETTDVSDQLENYAQAEAELISKSEINQALGEMVQEYQENPARGIVLTEVAGGWQFRTRPENASAVRYFYQAKPTRLSKPGLETLAIVAYRQPITRVEIDEIRGVDSGGVLKTLCEKNLVRIVGKKDEPGKPMLYGTTQEFLELFQLKNLKELPTLKDYRDLEAEFRKKSGEEGVVTEAEPEEAEVGEPSMLDLAMDGALEPLDQEEEAILGDLEDNIKEVRKVEKEIFSEEKEKEKPQDDAAPPQEVPSSS